MAAYYNEIDPAAAHLLRCLIEDGVIAPGDVDERSIKDVQPSDLKGYTQCHFFAGGGLWSVAARLAGWPDDRTLWTGSCPCQPFSVAGKGKGVDDQRHLWPVFFKLIRACRPPVVMGEQVAGAAGYGWFDGVAADLEGEDYACRAVDIPACAVDAPHIRQRLYWCAVGDANAMRELQSQGRVGEQRRWFGDASSGDMANADCEQLRGRHAGEPSRAAGSDEAEAWEWKRLRADARTDGSVECVHLADADEPGLEGRRAAAERAAEQPVGTNGVADAARLSQREPHDDMRAVAWEDARAGAGGSGERHSAWAGAEWRTGADGKARRVKPGIRLLADGVPNRVASLRIAGNAIVPQVAAEVIRAFMDVGGVDG